MKKLIHRRACDGRALTRELLLQSVDWQVIRTLCDRNVGEEARAIRALLDDLWRAGRGDDASTAAATQDLLNVLEAHELCGHELPDEGALARAHRREVGAAARRAAAKRVDHLVLDPHNWSFRFGLGALSARRLDLLWRGRLGGLDPWELRALAARAVQRLLQLGILLLKLGQPMGELVEKRLQRALMIDGRQDHADF